VVVVTSAEPVSPAETPDLYGAFPRLDPQQLAALAANGRRRRTQAGEVLYREGDRDCDFFAIAEGKVAVVEGYGGEERVIAVHGPGRFLGELGLLIGQPAFLTAVVRAPGEVVVVPVDRLRQMVVDDPTLGDLILRAYLLRRSMLIELGSGFRIVGSRYSPDLEGISVHYAATLVEARQCRNDPVAVVGGGNSAGQATVFLAQHAARVHLLVREPDLGVNMSRYLADRIERNPRVEVSTHTEVRELLGEDRLEAVVVEDNRTGERRTVPARQLFVFIGTEPHARWLGGQLALDDGGYILTGPDAARATTANGTGPWAGAEADPGAGPQLLLLETSRPGVFAAGDVRSGSTKRVASAVGEGAMAVRLVHEYLARVAGHPGLQPTP
jgi:thioredoxin reductase